MQKLLNFTAFSRFVVLLFFGCSFLISCSRQGGIQRPQGNIGLVEEVQASFGDDVSSADEDFLQTGLTDANTADDKFLQMVKDVGGFDAYNALALNDEAKFRQLHLKHGIGYVTDRLPGSPSTSSGGLSSQAITDCVPFYPPSDRNKMFVVGQGSIWNDSIRHRVYIDGVGRPYQAVDVYGAFTQGVATAPRQPDCQSKVGRWGNATDDGGHLIGAQLGGWGGRANIAPQFNRFNGGTWLRIENSALMCARSRKFYYTYEVRVQYPNSTTVRPGNFISASRATPFRLREGDFIPRSRITYPNNLYAINAQGLAETIKIQNYWRGYCR